MPWIGDDGVPEHPFARQPPDGTLRGVPSVQVKGTNFHTLLACMRSQLGADKTQEIVAAVVGPAGEALRDGSIGHTGWYPSAWLSAVYQAAIVLTGANDFPQEMARVSVKRDLGGIYRLLTFALTPESSLKRAPRIFQTYFRGARMNMLESSTSHAILEFECPGFDEYLWADLRGGATGVVEACGGKNVTVVTLPQPNADKMRVRVRWS